MVQIMKKDIREKKRKEKEVQANDEKKGTKKKISEVGEPALRKRLHQT